MQIQREHNLHVRASGGVAGEPRITLGVENKDAFKANDKANSSDQ